MSKLNISATIDSDLFKKLEEIAKETERNRSWLLTKAIELYLEELEDLKLAKERLNDSRLTPAEMRKVLRV